MQDSLNSIGREENISSAILGKPSLRKLYLEIYSKYKRVTAESPASGLLVELGAGAGFSKDIIPQMITTDVIAYSGIDLVVDATKMPFENSSVSAFFMTNVLHHVSNPEGMFTEISRCLKPAGKVLIIDQYPGFPARIIYKYLHHEPFDDKSQSWFFNSTGPLSGANGALPWIIFRRDRQKFEALFPQLRIDKIVLHTPFRYWLTGGLKPWCLLPSCLFGTATVCDNCLIKLSNNFGSFMDIELQKSK